MLLQDRVLTVLWHLLRDTQVYVYDVMVDEARRFSRHFEGDCISK
jgi:hypothetical protein